MKQQNELKIFILGQFNNASEWSSLLGDKYKDALSFKLSFEEDYKKAQVIVWDGIISPKGVRVFQEIEETLREEGRILLLQRSAYTLHSHYPFVNYINLDQIRYVELPSGGVLPEDLLVALETCHKKLYNVQ